MSPAADPYWPADDSRPRSQAEFRKVATIRGSMTCMTAPDSCYLTDGGARRAVRKRSRHWSGSTNGHRQLGYGAANPV